MESRERELGIPHAINISLSIVEQKIPIKFKPNLVHSSTYILIDSIAER